MIDKEEICRKIDGMEPAMIDTWKKLVNRDCGPDCKEGVDAVGRDVERFLKPLGFKVRFHVYEKAGNMLVAEYGDMTKPFVLLTGHMDTVFARGTAAERPFQMAGDRVTGPGVLDMKGGLAICFARRKRLSTSAHSSTVWFLAPSTPTAQSVGTSMAVV
jgi:glutamate carboxypeptidase